MTEEPNNKYLTLSPISTLQNISYLSYLGVLYSTMLFKCQNKITIIFGIVTLLVNLLPIRIKINDVATESDGGTPKYSDNPDKIAEVFLYAYTILVIFNVLRMEIPTW